MKKIILTITAVMLMTASVYAAEESEIKEISVGEDREEIHSKLGAPDSISLGYKETYALPDGSVAVLSYNEEKFEMGFIVIKNPYEM